MHIISQWEAQYVIQDFKNNLRFLKFCTPKIPRDKSNTWSPGPSMDNARYFHGLVSDGSRLFAIGGQGTAR